MDQYKTDKSKSICQDLFSLIKNESRRFEDDTIAVIVPTGQCPGIQRQAGKINTPAFGTAQRVRPF